jgi:pyruvate,water dikinase
MSEGLAPSPATGARGSERWLRSLSDAVDPAVCGGKAAGLARLLRAGFPVPDGICLTTDFFRAALHGTDLAARVDELAADASLDPQARRDGLAEIRRLAETVSLPAELAETIQRAMKSLRRRWNGMLAVRSSAVLEDHADASHAGIHVTFVGQYAADAVVARIKACWASLWTERAWVYRERAGIPHANAAMAVVVQRFVAGGRAGVAFSADPVTADPATIVIEAAWGTGEAVVAGAVTPDHYRVTVSDGKAPVMRSELSSPRPVLTDAEVRTLARLVKRVERALGVAADVEWAYDGWTFWIVQGRPLRRGEARRDQTLWTRANLKEVFPEQPSPLALSYLSVALNGMSREYHSAQGYEVPASARLVGVFRGRPYLNLTLMDQMTVARGGKPEVAWRLFGGATPPPPRPDPPAFRPHAGPRPGVRLACELLTTVFLTPRLAQRLFRRMRQQAQSYAAVPLERLDDAALNGHLIRFGDALLNRARLRRLHEIVSAQSRAYIILERLLSAWIPANAERLLTELMTGLGTLPNARLTYRLMALSAMARAEPRVEAFLRSARDREAVRAYRAALAGSRFVAELDRLLREFGHRGPFESDVMSPRFGEDPEPLLRMIQAYLRMPALETADRHEADRRRIREAAQHEARLSLRAGRPSITFAAQWMVLSVVCAALQRLVAQRDENRHVTTLLVAHLRQIALEIGRRAARDGRLAASDDVFFVLWDELPTLLAHPDRDWRAVIAGRRREHARHATMAAPDLLRGDEPAEEGPAAAESATRGTLTGFGVSPGTVTGTVKLIRSPAELGGLSGEIAVLPAIEPSLASIFPVVSGLVAEIGGVLSHAAILAREYGLPAVVNVKDVTRHLRDGDRVELNGTTGRIRLLGRLPGAGDAAVAVPHDERGDHEPDQRAGDDV